MIKLSEILTNTRKYCYCADITEGYSLQQLNHEHQRKVPRKQGIFG